MRAAAFITRRDRAVVSPTQSSAKTPRSPNCTKWHFHKSMQNSELCTKHLVRQMKKLGLASPEVMGIGVVCKHSHIAKVPAALMS